MYSNNESYKLVKQYDKYRIYVPVQTTDYHKQREVEATIQNIYSNAGATADTIRGICQAGLEMINKDKSNESLRTNMAAILNNLMYRTDHPVDSLCSIRMGAILTYMEHDEIGSDGKLTGRIISEPEHAVLPWIDKKIQLALQHPELYDFFLTWGIQNTPAYETHLPTLTDMNYFHRREETIQSFSPSAQK